MRWVRSSLARPDKGKQEHAEWVHHIPAVYNDSWAQPSVFVVWGGTLDSQTRSNSWRAVVRKLLKSHRLITQTIHETWFCAPFRVYFYILKRREKIRDVNCDSRLIFGHAVALKISSLALCTAIGVSCTWRVRLTCDLIAFMGFRKRIFPDKMTPKAVAIFVQSRNWLPHASHSSVIYSSELE